MKLVRVELVPRAIWTVAFGVCCCKVVMSAAPVCSRRSLLTAVTATGTSFRLSSRRRAVTTMSSTLEACSVSVACWAKLGAAQIEAVMKTLLISARRNCPVVRILVSSPRAVV